MFQLQDVPYFVPYKSPQLRDIQFSMMENFFLHFVFKNDP